jgi:succinylglutamate desuccinylase
MNGSEPAVVDRVLGVHETGRHGPTVLIISGIHGNEPAGVTAARQVFSTLAEHEVPFRGRLWAVAGNLTALATRQRYVDQDLNRLWTAEQIVALDRSSPDRDDAEQGEQRALLEIFRRLAAEATRENQPLVVLDLHSTSGPSVPFTVINDTLESRRLAQANPVPLLLGLEEVLEGTLLDYMEDQGHPYVLFEGGQHRGVDTVASLEAATWHVLAALGAVSTADVPAFAEHDLALRRAVEHEPRALEISYLHEIHPDDDFRMKPGYRSFAPVAAGDVLATDRHGDVVAPSDGLLMLPLYQPWGTDGFFIGRPVGRAWLTLSAWLRAIGTGRILPVLPGVTRDGSRPDVLLVNPRIARWLVIEIFHLAGFRRLRSPKGSLAFRDRSGG